LNDTTSCASCHIPERHFTDGRALAIGATGVALKRNTPTLYNTAFNASYGWSDLGLTTLEAQHLVPLLGRDPIEMGFEESQLVKLATDAALHERFQQAFANSNEPVSIEHIVQALASYVRTLRAPSSSFDKYLFFDEHDALSELAQEGMALFFSEDTGCATCHASLSFSGPVRHAAQTAAPAFHVTAVSNSSIAFRAPTLRAIKHTAPYMHDGSLTSLQEVLRHYESVDVERVPKFKLTAHQRNALIAFLETL